MSNPLMGHLVLGYPTLPDSIATAEAYIAAGVQILELQIPFSDPSADGFTITEANHVAIANGTTIAQCLSELKALHSRHPQQAIVPMTYVNKLFAYGVERLAAELVPLNMASIIVPDLALDSPLARQVIAAGLKPVPVLATNVTETRLNLALAHQPEYVYLMADFKITGQQFTLHERLVDLVGRIRKQSSARIGIGFGISSGAHVQAVLQLADFAIVGSSLIEAQKAQALDSKLKELVGA